MATYLAVPKVSCVGAAGSGPEPCWPRSAGDEVTRLVRNAAGRDKVCEHRLAGLRLLDGRGEGYWSRQLCVGVQPNSVCILAQSNADFGSW